MVAMSEANAACIFWFSMAGMAPRLLGGATNARKKKEQPFDSNMDSTYHSENCVLLFPFVSVFPNKVPFLSTPPKYHF